MTKFGKEEAEERAEAVYSVVNSNYKGLTAKLQPFL